MKNSKLYLAIVFFLTISCNPIYSRFNDSFIQSYTTFNYISKSCNDAYKNAATYNDIVEIDKTCILVKNQYESIILNINLAKTLISANEMDKANKLIQDINLLNLEINNNLKQLEDK